MKQETEIKTFEEYQNSCKCDKCCQACTVKPGWFKPGEAELAAELMKMPFKKFFNHFLAVDWWCGGLEDIGDIYVLAPALKHCRPGEKYPQGPLGECVFYGNETKECLIQQAKPYECRMYWHGSKHEDNVKQHKVIAESWKDHQKQIHNLLGYNPP